MSGSVEPSPLEVFFGRPQSDPPKPVPIPDNVTKPSPLVPEDSVDDNSWEPETDQRFGQETGARTVLWERVQGIPRGIAAAVIAVMVAGGFAVVAAGALGGTPANPDLPFAVVSGSATGHDSAPKGASGESSAASKATSEVGGDTPDGDSTSVSVSPPAASDVVVHVAGAVEQPGVYALRDGARVHDAIAAAGGMRHDADPDAINLAETLFDGARIHIPVPGEVTRHDIVQFPPNAPGGSETGRGADVPVSLNAATSQQLEALPGVGPATADAIIEHRTADGLFGSVDDLMAVRGIGPAKLEALRDLVIP